MNIVPPPPAQTPCAKGKSGQKGQVVPSQAPGIGADVIAPKAKLVPKPPATAPPPAMRSGGIGPVANMERGTLPDWATFENNVANWWELLDAWQVDEAARQDLFHLAQTNKPATNDIVWKLIKARCDRRRLGNPSGWVHNNVKRAEHGQWPY